MLNEILYNNMERILITQTQHKEVTEYLNDSEMHEDDSFIMELSWSELLTKSSAKILTG